MKLTNADCTKLVTRLWKQMWKTRGKVSVRPLQPHHAKLYAERGIKLVDPSIQYKVKPEKWVPPVDDSVFRELPKEEDQINYNEDPTYLFHSRIRLTQNFDQACILAKAVRMHANFPSPVSDMMDKFEIPDQDGLVQRYIMQSQVWDPTMEKKPKRIDRAKYEWHFQREYGIPSVKSAIILLRNMIQLCHSLAGQHPSIVTDRHLVHMPYISTNIRFEGQLITIQSLYQYLLSGHGLPTFASTSAVDKTVTSTLPNIAPISPLINLKKEHCYSHDTTPAVLDTSPKGTPQTLFLINNDYWSEIDRQARALMMCLAVTAAHAKAKYGPDVGALPEPISVQCINMNPNVINFLFFQLNTLDFSSSNGVKNIVWSSPKNILFEKILSKPWEEGEEFKKTRYRNYDPEVFKKFLAVMMYGVTV